MIANYFFQIYRHIFYDKINVSELIKNTLIKTHYSTLINTFIKTTH